MHLIFITKNVLKSYHIYFKANSVDFVNAFNFVVVVLR